VHHHGPGLITPLTIALIALLLLLIAFQVTHGFAG
jgi:hypothetical protein